MLLKFTCYVQNYAQEQELCSVSYAIYIQVIYYILQIILERLFY